jgi:hypothetical protein
MTVHFFDGGVLAARFRPSVGSYRNSGADELIRRWSSAIPAAPWSAWSAARYSATTAGSAVPAQQRAQLEQLLRQSHWQPDAALPPVVRRDPLRTADSAEALPRTCAFFFFHYEGARLARVGHENVPPCSKTGRLQPDVRAAYPHPRLRPLHLAPGLRPTLGAQAFPNNVIPRSRHRPRGVKAASFTPLNIPSLNDHGQLFRFGPVQNTWQTSLQDRSTASATASAPCGIATARTSTPARLPGQPDGPAQ